jgi:hypothetical protein
VYTNIDERLEIRHKVLVEGVSKREMLRQTHDALADAGEDPDGQRLAGLPAIGPDREA